METMPEQSIRWETVACPLCGDGRDREFLRANGDDGVEYRLAECPTCGMVFTNPRPDESSIGHFYPEDYSPYQLPTRQRLRPRRRHRERLLSDRIPVQQDGVWLDYGCGSGWFASQMRDRGWKALGMDFSAHAAAAARKNFGLDVVHGVLPHPAIAAGSIDVVTLRAVLEHVHDPRHLLDSVHAVLRPVGWLYASVPNLASWGFRAFGTAWFPLDPPRHLLHFTDGTLRRIVEDCGFEVQAMTTLGHTKWMGYSVDRALRSRPKWWVKACRVHLVRSALTRWTRWTCQGDDLAILARKPATAPAAVPLRKAA
jgi:SAM-dependent methyltransferase